MKILGGLPQTFTRAQAIDCGLDHRRLVTLQASGDIERISRGVYRRTGAALVDLDLLEIAARRPRATLCLISALARHDLTDLIPATHDIALPRGSRTPDVNAPATWHKFDKATFGVGRTELAVDDETTIGLYDATRTLVDVYRLPNLVSPDIAHEALRRWLRSGGRSNALWQRAQTFPRTTGPLLHALQVLQ